MNATKSIRTFLEEYAAKRATLDPTGQQRLDGVHNLDAFVAACPKCNANGFREGEFGGPRQRSICSFCDGARKLPTKKGAAILELFAVTFEPMLADEAQPAALEEWNREHAAAFAQQQERETADRAKKQRAELVREMLGEALENGADSDELIRLLAAKKSGDPQHARRIAESVARNPKVGGR